MSMTLAEFAKQSPTKGEYLVSQIADWTLMNCDVLKKLEWDTNSALTVKIRAWSSFPTIGTRKIGAAFNESTGKFEEKVEDKYIFGDLIDTDTVLLKADPMTREYQRKAAGKAMGFKFNNMFINGDPASDEFKGLKKRVDDIYAAGFTDQYFDAGSSTNGRGVLYDSTEQHYFLDMIHKIIEVTAEESPDGLFMNSKLYLCVESACRRTNLLKQDKDQYDRIINSFNGIPIYKMGPVSAFSTTLIMPNDETLSSGTDETSIYSVKLGVEEYLWGIQQQSMEVTDIGLLEAGTAYRDVVQWVVGLAVSNPRAVARAYGFVADAGAS